MLLTTRRVKLIGKKKFVVIALDPDHKAFVVYVAVLNISSNVGNKIYLSKKAQIAYLKIDKALKELTNKYVDFINIFSSELATELSKHTYMNNYTIKLVND